MALRPVSSLAHACSGCGGSCQGVRVRVLPAEEAALRTHADLLGVPDPLDDGRLRFVEGRCVFLGTDARCALHARFGADAKPAICRQYPLVLVDTGSELRAGIDPGCYSAATSLDQPPLAPDGSLAHRVLIEPTAERQEAAILGLLATPGLTIAAALEALGAAPGFEARWRAAVRAAPLAALLARPETGNAVRAALAGPIAAVAAVADGDPAAQPLALAPAEEAWAIEVARRMVALRLCSSFPFVPGVVLLALGGAHVCGWADPRPAAFGPALAGWARAMRAPIWWSALVPGPEAMRGLFGR